jgi:hypothetical protein
MEKQSQKAYLKKYWVKFSQIWGKKPHNSNQIQFKDEFIIKHNNQTIKNQRQITKSNSSKRDEMYFIQYN